MEKDENKFPHYKKFQAVIKDLLFNGADHLDKVSYGLRAYFLNFTDQSRIFMLPRETVDGDIYCPPPEEGRFVGCTTQGDELILTFMQFPEGSFESAKLAALAYKDFEYDKASKHIGEWLEKAVVPVADGEVTQAVCSTPTSEFYSDLNVAFQLAINNVVQDLAERAKAVGAGVPGLSHSLGSAAASIFYNFLQPEGMGPLTEEHQKNFKIFREAMITGFDAAYAQLVMGTANMEAIQ